MLLMDLMGDRFESCARELAICVPHHLWRTSSMDTVLHPWIQYALVAHCTSGHGGSFTSKIDKIKSKDDIKYCTN